MPGLRLSNGGTPPNFLQQSRLLTPVCAYEAPVTPAFFSSGATARLYAVASRPVLSFALGLGKELRFP